MFASIYYPFPNGQPLGVDDFIKLWLREIIIAGFLIISLLAAGVRLLWRRLQNQRGHGK